MQKQVRTTPVHIPPPFAFESLSSWLTRFAMFHFISLYEAKKFFNISSNDAQVDAWLNVDRADLLQKQFALPPGSFKESVHIFSRLTRLQSGLACFLNKTNDAGFATYRYCPVCLHSQKVKYFHFLWRFSVWKICPLHNCLLEDRCLTCGELVTLPINLVSTKHNPHGIPSLSYCVHCGNLLSKHWHEVWGITSKRLLSEEEHRFLENGRAVLAALDRGHFFTSQGKKVKLSLRYLVPMSKTYCPKAIFAITNQDLLDRLNVKVPSPDATQGQ